MSIVKALTEYCINQIGHSRHINVDKVHDQLLDFLISTGDYGDELYKTKSKYHPVSVLHHKSDVSEMLRRKFYNVGGIHKTRKGFTRDMIQIRGPIKLSNIDIEDITRYSRLGKIFDRIVNNVNRGISMWTKNLFRRKRFARYIREVPPFNQIAHRDAIQLIPPNLYNFSKVTRYAGAPLGRVDLNNIKITSKGALQGIFSSDGILEQVNINNCNIDIRGAHSVSLSGLLTGSFRNMRNGRMPLPVKLYPLRLGGGKYNINILSFSPNSPYKYGTITGDNANIEDLRRTPMGRGMDLIDFDLPYFHQKMMKAQELHGFNELLSVKEIVNHMLLRGKATDLGALLNDLLQG